MRQGAGPILRCFAAVCLLAGTAAVCLAQDDLELTAKTRLFPAVGPGLRAIKRDAAGRYYVLASPGPGLTVFAADGKTLLQIPSGQPSADPSKPKPPIQFGEDCDVDADGRIYVSDRGANAVKIFSPQGQLLRAIPAPALLSLALLPGGEVAVSTSRGPHLVTVFNSSGRVAREFGSSEDISSRPDLNRMLNSGHMVRDAHDFLYFAFDYLPEPTVRQFDSNGYSRTQIELATIEILPRAQATRREIERLESHGETPRPKRVITAMGVDPESAEVWIALENVLFRFNREGNLAMSYRLFSPDGVRLDATAILVEPARLLIGADPGGVYEFARPDKQDSSANAKGSPKAQEKSTKTP